MLSSDLRDRTLILLRNRPPITTLQKIADETGLTKRWLENFLNSVVDDPGSSKVETLYVFLTGKPLELEPKDIPL